MDLDALFGHCPETVTLSFDSGPVPLLEVSLFTDGALPDWVQQWEPPVEDGADLVLFSTHADDEQLFFAGVLPYYAGELGYRVQVVYLTNHRNLSKNPNLRCHEALDGQIGLDSQLLPLKLGKVVIEYPHDQNQRGQQHGDSRQADGTENFLCHDSLSSL